MEIHEGGWRCSVNPKKGLVTALRFQDQDVLRPAPVDCTEPTDASAFVMGPFAGRIAGGQFQWAGQAVTLPVTAPHAPHANHGHGWQLPWQVVSHAQASLTLALDWSDLGAQHDWPWAYRLEQRLQVTAAGLQVRLSLENRGVQAMPAGLGWHPYFRKDDAVISAPLSHRWEIDQAVLPLERTALPETAPVRQGQALAGCGYDNPFQRDGGDIQLHWPDSGQRVLLRCQPEQGFLVIFEHPNENCFCVEPVTHVPNALNLNAPPEQTGLHALAPGESLMLECAILRPDEVTTSH